MVWTLRSDGQLCGLTYVPSQQVFAWHRHILGGAFGTGGPVIESMDTIPDSTTGEDMLYLAVKRTIDGATVRHIEVVQPYFYPSSPTDKTNMRFVDCFITVDTEDAISTCSHSGGTSTYTTDAAHGLENGDIVEVKDVVSDDPSFTYNGTHTVSNKAATTFDVTGMNDPGTYTSGGTVQTRTVRGLSHLEGESVIAVIDGSEHPALTVASGVINLTWAGASVHVGLAYTAKLEMLNPEAAAVSGSTAQMKRTRVHRLGIRLKDSKIFSVGGNASRLNEFTVRDDNDPMDASAPLYTGDKVISLEDTPERDKHVIIQTSRAFPLNILAVISKLHRHGG